MTLNVPLVPQGHTKWDWNSAAPAGDGPGDGWVQIR